MGNIQLSYRRLRRWSAVFTWAALTLGGGKFAHALEIPTRVTGLDFADAAAKTADTLVFLDDGRVVRLRPEHSKLLAELREAELTEERLVIEVDEQNYVLQLLRGSPSEVPEALSHASPTPTPSAYQPTVLPSLEATSAIFRTFNPSSKAKSQCYNRAHIWAYESKQRFNLDSMKIFLFFTRKFIREYNFGWWFHVAPYTLVQTPTGPVAQVLDFKFLKERPVPVQTWTDYFVSPHPKCPVVTRYQDYSEHQNESYCYVIQVPMYYWQPRDIEAVSRGRPAKTKFIPNEVNWAYQEGFE